MQLIALGVLRDLPFRLESFSFVLADGFRSVKNVLFEAVSRCLDSYPREFNTRWGNTHNRRNMAARSTQGRLQKSEIAFRRSWFESTFLTFLPNFPFLEVANEELTPFSFIPI